METRKRARLAEEMEVERGREKDRKGKEVMKEERVEEIYEILDDSEEDENRLQSRTTEEWEQYAIGIN